MTTLTFCKTEVRCPTCAKVHWLFGVFLMCLLSTHLLSHVVIGLYALVSAFMFNTLVRVSWRRLVKRCLRPRECDLTEARGVGVPALARAPSDPAQVVSFEPRFRRLSVRSGEPSLLSWRLCLQMGAPVGETQMMMGSKKAR